MSDCRLKILGQKGLIREEQVSLSSFERGPLGALCSLFINRTKKARCALVEQDGALRALFLYNDFLPRDVVRFGAPLSTKGLWFTHQLFVGDYGGGRLLVGPAAVVRQVDLPETHAQLATCLYQLSALSGVEPIFERRPRGQTYRLTLNACQYYYRELGGTFDLLGAGNTPRHLVESLLKAEPDEVNFLRAVGATSVPSQALWAAHR